MNGSPLTVVLLDDGRDVDGTEVFESPSADPERMIQEKPAGALPCLDTFSARIFIGDRLLALDELRVGEHIEQGRDGDRDADHPGAIARSGGKDCHEEARCQADGGTPAVAQVEGIHDERGAHNCKDTEAFVFRRQGEHAHDGQHGK